MYAEELCKDEKPTKHTQTLALRKASMIVQMQNHTSTHIHLFLKEKIKINRKEEENDTLRRTY